MNSPESFLDLAHKLVVLQTALQQSAPPDVLQRFAPQLSYGRHFGPPAWDARRAAVTILLYWHQQQWYVPMTLRPETLGLHGGQVSFPGGRVEADETDDECAYREWCEELGDPAVDFRWVGQLHPIYVFHSNYVVTPCLALAHSQPLFAPDEREVAEVLEVPLAHLIDPTNYGAHWIQRGGISFLAPHIEFNGRLIWGATAILLAELLIVVEKTEIGN
jgi:8-oxo-dGTP pyrophosphatase MutT (NUDIX family)